MKGRSNRYSLIVFTITVLLCSGSTCVYGQNAAKAKVMYWIQAGLGRSSLGSLAGRVGLGLQLKHLIFSIGGTQNVEEVGIFSSGDQLGDLGLLIGIGTRDHKVHASFSVGVARVAGSRYVETPPPLDCFLFDCISGETVDINPTIGFPLEFQFFHKAYRSSAIGLSFYWNINHEESFGSITVGFMFGKLR
jgi:hypothetical protein